jgi:hypothetical protein
MKLLVGWFGRSDHEGELGERLEEPALGGRFQPEFVVASSR